MNPGGEAMAALGAVAVVAVLLLGAALEAWMDYRDDVATRREWEARMRERGAEKRGND